MRRTEAGLRFAAAQKRLADAEPAAWVVVVAPLLLHAAFRYAVYLCVGFGAASVLDVSAWWGLPGALVASQTIGRLWSWWRRDAVVKAIEEAADKAEAAKESS